MSMLKKSPHTIYPSKRRMRVEITKRIEKGVDYFTKLTKTKKIIHTWLPYIISQRI